jgi:hypothetical protein
MVASCPAGGQPKIIQNGNRRRKAAGEILHAVGDRETPPAQPSCALGLFAFHGTKLLRSHDDIVSPAGKHRNKKQAKKPVPCRALLGRGVNGQ